MVNEYGSGYRHQVVADLAWALSSPPLMCPLNDCLWPSKEWFEGVYRDALPWLKRLDEDPTDLMQLLDRQSDRRLGKYFETLWHFWLLHQSRYELVHANLQVIIDGKTLGELDFILFDKQQRCFVHWELAVKFYLGVGETGSLSCWHGPGRRDRLDRKFEHLCVRQSRISQVPEVKQWLAEKDIEIDKCQAILKGRLYYHKKLADASDWPLHSDVHHLKSFWLTLKEFDSLVDSSFAFMPLIKQGWLAKVSTNSKSRIWSKTQLIEAFSNKELRLPVQIFSDKLLFNNDTFFIVGDNWLSGIT